MRFDSDPKVSHLRPEQHINQGFSDLKVTIKCNGNFCQPKNDRENDNDGNTKIINAQKKNCQFMFFKTTTTF